MENKSQNCGDKNIVKPKFIVKSKSPISFYSKSVINSNTLCNFLFNNGANYDATVDSGCTTHTWPLNAPISNLKPTPPSTPQI